MNVVPCDEDGNEELDEDLLPDEPEELLENEIYFKVKIDHLSDLPDDFCSNVYCEYQFYFDE